MGIGWRWGLGTCGILLAQTASAAEGFTTPSAPVYAARTGTPASSLPAAPPPQRWYGWQILISDVSSVLLGGVVAPIGAVGYLVTPPVIHLAHGQGMRALASVGLRLGLPLAGAAVAIVGSDSCSNGELDLCSVGWTAVGVLVGLSGMGLDIAFANEPVHPPQPVGLHFQPQLLISDRELRLGLLGSF